MNVTQSIAVQKKKQFFQAKDLEDEMASTIQPTAKQRKNQFVLKTTCDWRLNIPPYIFASWSHDVSFDVASFLPFWCSPLSNDAFSQMHQGVHPPPPSQVGHFKGCIMVWKPELRSSCCHWWVTFSFNAISILKINSCHLCFPFWPQYVAAEVLPKKQDID